jgi:hypothetical protein
MQSELARAHLVERVQQASTRAALLIQQQTQRDDEMRRVAAEREVEETPEAQSEHIDGDEESGTKGERPAHERKAARQESPPPKRRRPPDGHRFDVSV